MTHFDHLQSDYNLIEKRCTRYREAYNDLKAHVKTLEVELPKRVNEARKESADELLLLRAQLRARNEEIAKFKELCVAQQKELVELVPALALLQGQVQVKDALIKSLDAERAKTKALQTFNAQLISELRRVNTQVAAESSIEDAAKQVMQLSDKLQHAEWKHGLYEVSLTVMKQRLAELEQSKKP